MKDWKTALESIFAEIPIEDCTPRAVLQTLQVMPRKRNNVHEITRAARSRNVAASDESVRNCLRTLYKEKKIAHRKVGTRDFFQVI